MGVLEDASAIFAAQDLKRESVPVPKWGGDVLMSELSAGKREEFYEWLRTQQANAITLTVPGYRERMVVLSAIKEDGSPLFTLDQVERLSSKSNAILTQLSDVAHRLSGLGVAAVEEAADELPNAESGSAS
jgi:hypothetical protein